MQELVDSLKNQGITNANRCTLYNHEERISLAQSRNSVPGSVIVDASRDTSVGSTANANNSSAVNTLTEMTNVDELTMNRDGRPKGTTVKARRQSIEQDN